MAESALLMSLDDLLGDAPPEEPLLLDAPVEETPAPVELPSRVLRLSPERKARLLTQLRKEYDEATASREESQTRRADRYRRFLCDPSLRDGRQQWDDAAKLFLPLTRSTLETLQTRFGKQLGENLDALMVQGIGEEDVQAATRKNQWLQFALTRINPTHWSDIVSLSLQDALLDSLAVLKVYPYEFPFEPDANDPAEAHMLRRYVRIDVVDLGTIGKPPNATGLQWPECRYIFQQLFVTADEFPALRERDFTLPGQEEIDRLAQRDEAELTEDERVLIEFQREGFEPSEAESASIEMVEHYTLFDIDGSGKRQFVVAHWFPSIGSVDGTATESLSGQISRVMLLKEALPQRVFPRPMWPFFPIKVWSQPRQLYGLNVPDRLESVQDMLNRLAEQMIEQGEVDILPFVFANVALAGEIPNLRRIRPGDVIPLDTMGAVQFSPQRSNNRHFVEQMQIGEGWAEKDLRVTAFTQGIQPTAYNEVDNTLGGLQLRQAAGDEAFESQVHKLARQYTEALLMFFGLWQSLFPEKVPIPVAAEAASLGLEARLLGDSGAEGGLAMEDVTYEDISGLFDLKIQVNPNAHVDQQKLMAMAEKMDVALVDKWPIGRRLLFKKVWEGLELQEFDTFYPEEVAIVETLLIVMRAQLELGQLEQQVLALGMIPGTIQMPDGTGINMGTGGQPETTQMPAQPAGLPQPQDLATLFGGGMPESGGETGGEMAMSPAVGIGAENG